jgi:tetratricopeptide (TPR) repeat protein
MARGRRRLLKLTTGLVTILAVALLLSRVWPQLFPDQLAKSHMAYDRHDWSAAATMAREKLREQPGNTDALHLLARAYSRMGRDDAAQELFSRLGNHAMEPEDFILLGSGLIRQDRIEPAIAVFEQARALAPSHPETLYELARLYARLKRFDDATALASQLTATPGWESRGSVILGILHQEQANPAGAAEALDRALRADPQLQGAPASSIEVRKLLARSLLETNQTQKAVACLEAIISNPPDHETSWLLSRAYLLSGDIPRANKFLTLAKEYATDDPLRSEPAPYVGAKACEKCHPAIYNSQQNSRHAQTFSLPKELASFPLPKQPLTDPAVPELTHTFTHEGETIRLVTHHHNDVKSALVEYALGSDHHGQTMIGRDEKGNARAFRLSVFNHGSLWDLTPNVPRPSASDPFESIGQYLSSEALEKCIDCHVTSIHSARSRHVPEAADHGIGCERCHGPGANHLAAVETKFPDLAIARPKLASAVQITHLCAACHNPDNPTISESDPLTIRFQTLTFPRSRCYTESSGGLSCITCHDPHKNAKSSTAHYQNVCLSCHATDSGKALPAISKPPSTDSAPHTTCPVNPTDACLKCHMPASPSAAHHTAFTDHHIRIRRLTEQAN